MNRRLIFWSSIALFVFSIAIVIGWGIFHAGDSRPLKLLLARKNEINKSLAVPIRKDGSISNLFHFLSKEPGRLNFPRISDRRRANAYLSSQSNPVNESWPAWAPAFIGGVRLLFNRITDDLMPMLGVHNSSADRVSVSDIDGYFSLESTEATRVAIEQFARNYQRDKYPASSVSKSEIRNVLLNQNRFTNLIDEEDNIWSDLIYKLYKLATHENWKIAVGLEPDLGVDLNTLLRELLVADIYRRSLDLLARIPQKNFSRGTLPGIVQVPKIAYYKNIPEIQGQTADETMHIFFVRVNLAYAMGDENTRRWINKHRIWLIDFMKSYFSSLKEDDLLASTQVGNESSAWRLAKLKSDLIHQVNSQIAAEMSSGTKKFYGVRDLAFTRINILEY